LLDEDGPVDRPLRFDLASDHAVGLGRSGCKTPGQRAVGCPQAIHVAVRAAEEHQIAVDRGRRIDSGVGREAPPLLAAIGAQSVNGVRVDRCNVERAVGDDRLGQLAADVDGPLSVQVGRDLAQSATTSGRIMSKRRPVGSVVCRRR